MPRTPSARVRSSRSRPSRTPAAARTQNSAVMITTAITFQRTGPLSWPKNRWPSRIVKTERVASITPLAKSTGGSPRPGSTGSLPCRERADPWPRSHGRFGGSLAGAVAGSASAPGVASGNGSGGAAAWPQTAHRTAPPFLVTTKCLSCFAPKSQWLNANGPLRTGPAPLPDDRSLQSTRLPRRRRTLHRGGAHGARHHPLLGVGAVHAGDRGAQPQRDVSEGADPRARRARRLRLEPRGLRLRRAVVGRERPHLPGARAR